MNVDKASRLIGALLAAVGGWRMADLVVSSDSGGTIHWGMALGFMIVGALLTPYLVIQPLNWLGNRIAQAAPHEIIACTIGLLIGLLAGALLAIPLSLLPDMAGRLLPIVGALSLAYLGVKVMLIHKDILAWSLPVVRNPKLEPGMSGAEHMHDKAERTKASMNGVEGLHPHEPKVVLDTSAIIDGRIADISQTGFITGTMIIPRFVLNELQHIADSSEVLRRNRGRRGLDILNKLQKDSVAPIFIYDIDFDDVHQVDAKLVKMAKLLHCPIVTQDFNLNRVAELQGVKVLNINELANAVKSVVLPGEEMSVKIIQEGKELGQGVGYLDDGTMVVVEGGRRWLSSEVEIVVTRVLQTVAGRMIFAHPKVD